MNEAELAAEAERVLDAAALELGLIGAFQKKRGRERHNKYRVVLPDDSIVLLPVYCTPKGPENYLRSLPGRLKSAITRNLDRRKKT